MATAKKEMMNDIGAAVLKEASRAVAKEVIASGGGGDLVALTGSAKTVSDILDAAVQGQQPVTIQLYRTDPMTAVDQFLGNISGVDPGLIKNEGLESLIQKWSGGGHYKGTIKCPALGIPDKRFSNIQIAGEPLAPYPERNKGGGALQQASPAQSAAYGGTPPLQQGPQQYWAGPGFGSYLGFAPLGQSHMQPQNPMNEMLQVMLHQNKELSERLLSGVGRNSDNEALKASERRAEEAERRIEAERAERRHKEEMAELRALIAAQAAPKENSTAEMVKAMAPVVAAVVPALLAQRGESATSMARLYESMIGANKTTTDQALGFMQASMAKTPVEERMANLMGSMLGMTTSMMQAMQQMQPDAPPFWQQMLGQALQVVGDIGQTAFSRDEIAASPAQPSLPPAPIQAPPAILRGRVPDDDAVAKAAEQAKAAMEAAAEVGEEVKEEEAEENKPTFNVPPRKQFDDGFRKIFDLIEGDGNAHDIAFRIWKHATSKNQLALVWFNKSEEVTFELLSAFVEREEMDITDERATEIADAIQDLYAHLAGGGTPEAFLAQYHIINTPPKAIQINPLMMASFDGKAQVELGQPVVDPSAPIEMKLVPSGVDGELAAVPVGDAAKPKAMAPEGAASTEQAMPLPSPTE